MMYKSPIEVVYGQLQTKFEDDVVKAVQSYNINVDKDELIKALAYDRGQYEAGYRDAIATIVRCKDCKHSYFVKSCSKYECKKGRGTLKYSNDFCSYGVAKMDGKGEGE